MDDPYLVPWGEQFRTDRATQHKESYFLPEELDMLRPLQELDSRNVHVNGQHILSL